MSLYFIVANVNYFRTFICIELVWKSIEYNYMLSLHKQAFKDKSIHVSKKHQYKIYTINMT